MFKTIISQSIEEKLPPWPNPVQSIHSEVIPQTLVTLDTNMVNIADNYFLCQTNLKIDPLVLTTLSKIEVEAIYGKEGKTLGSGTYGTVLKIGQKYALKKMEENSQGISYVAIREVATFIYLGKFPNILNVYNVDIDTNNSVNLIMELANEGSLKDFYPK